MLLNVVRAPISQKRVSGQLRFADKPVPKAPQRETVFGMKPENWLRIPEQLVVGRLCFYFDGAKIASRRAGVPSTLSKCGYRSPP